MSRLRRLVLVRHGESTGNSAERLIGSGDPDLAPEGREQVRAGAIVAGTHVIEVVVASSLRRAWQSAWLLADGTPVRLEPDFKEIDFGRWEGRTLAEVEAADPDLFAQWRDRADGFEYPAGELKADFLARVDRGLGRLEASGVRSALLVAHKGVVRAIVEKLTGETLDRERPQLGEQSVLTRRGDGTWYVGHQSSNPAGLAAPAPVETVPA